MDVQNTDHTISISWTSAMSENWRPVGVFIKPLVDMRNAMKHPAANDTGEPPARLEPTAFLAFLEEPQPDDDPPAAA